MPAFRATGNATGMAGNANFVINIPSAAQVGDLAVAAIHYYSNGNVAPPNLPGWTQRLTEQPDGTFYDGHAVYTRLVQAGDPGQNFTSNLVANGGSFQAGVAWCAAYSGVDQSTPVADAQWGTRTYGVSANHTGAVTVGRNASLVVDVFGGRYNVNPTAPSGYTVRGMVNDSGDKRVGFADGAANRGSLGTRTYGNANANGARFATLVLNPPNQAPTTPGTPSVGSTANAAAVPVSWTASTDPDGEDVQYWLDLSTDNGATWTRWANNITTNSVTLDLRPAGPSTQARVRVLAGQNPDVGAYSAWSASSAAFSYTTSFVVASNSFQSDATGHFNGRKIDRCQDGTLWATSYGAPNSNGGGDRVLHLAYSKDGGATWTGLGTDTTVGAIRHASSASFFIDADDYAHLVFKQAGGSPGSDLGGARVGGFLYYMRGTPNAGRTAWTWSTAQSFISDTATNYPDVVAHREGTGWAAHIAFSYNDGSGTNYAAHQRFAISSAGVITAGTLTTLTAAGTYQTNAHTYPSIDFHHTGDGKTVAGGTPHLYVGWTAGTNGAGKGTRFRKAVYSGGAWTWNPEREVSAADYVQPPSWPWLVTLFDGARVCIVGGFINSNNPNHRVVIFDIDAAESVTRRELVAVSNSGSDPLSLYWGSAAYDRQGNLYLWGSHDPFQGGGSNNKVINRRKWNRATATFEAAVTLTTTSNGVPYLSARRGAGGNTIDVVWTDGTASPYSVVFDRLLLPALTPYVPAIML